MSTSQILVAAGRAPTVSFTVDGWKPRAVTEELARRGICAWDGDYYASS